MEIVWESGEIFCFAVDFVRTERGESLKQPCVSVSTTTSPSRSDDASPFGRLFEIPSSRGGRSSSFKLVFPRYRCPRRGKLFHLHTFSSFTCICWLIWKAFSCCCLWEFWFASRLIVKYCKVWFSLLIWIHCLAVKFSNGSFFLLAFCLKHWMQCNECLRVSLFRLCFGPFVLILGSSSIEYLRFNTVRLIVGGVMVVLIDTDIGSCGDIWLWRCLLGLVVVCSSDSCVFACLEYRSKGNRFISLSSLLLKFVFFSKLVQVYGSWIHDGCLSSPLSLFPKLLLRLDNLSC